MSKTYRDMIRGRLRAAQKKFEADDKYHEWVWRRYYTYTPRFSGKNKKENWWLVKQEKPEYQGKDPWNLLTFKEQGCIFRGYSRNPSWWNRLYGTKPNRRREHDLCQQYLGTTIIDRPDLDEKFYGRRIHCDYYW